jgi:hypothetical protein
MESVGYFDVQEWDQITGQHFCALGDQITGQHFCALWELFLQKGIQILCHGTKW